eukprot:ANDGO_02257.mRNA.1 Cysteine--tRNA ligase
MAGIRVLNSLSKTKEEFIPITPGLVKWYTCGPTVYDEAHIGHGRNYVSIDILRRVLEDYFNLQTTFVMNITDVDDKIILRGNLLFLKQLLQCEAAAAVASESFFLEAKSIADDEKNEKNMARLLNAQQMLLKGFEAKGISKDKYPNSADYDAVSRRFEREFLEDMDRLNVKRPHALTRVTEYVEEIVSYIQKIVGHGYAYESAGSVYFDVKAFQARHTYAKLQPNAVGNAELFQEGEGSLSVELTSQKRSNMDFALWKASKAGEPAWNSPWGAGRPGWHIECSAMASDILGDKIDLHSGGIDLLFPHHDNEIAQAEAHGDCDEWVNYWMHVGHLHIQGLKMSRSKKNFFSIRSILERFTANQIRMFCALHKYEAPVDYSENAMERCVSIEKIFSEYFSNTKIYLRSVLKENGAVLKHEKYVAADFNMQKTLSAAQIAIDHAFRDNFNIPLAMENLQDLVRASNAYVSTGVSKPNLVLGVAQFVARMMSLFGFTDNLDATASLRLAASQATDSNVSKEVIVGPYLDALAQFRGQVRSLAREKQLPTAFLELCDDLRDNVLLDIGVRLEDAQGVLAWKLGDPKEFRAERQRTLDAAEAKRKAKEEAKLKAAEKEQAKREKAAKPSS